MLRYYLSTSWRAEEKPMLIVGLYMNDLGFELE
jgi:hypothetical protein